MSALRLLALAALLFPLAAQAQSVPRAFIAANNGSAASSLAGDPGEHVAEINGNGFLYQLQFDELSDRPCWLKAYFWTAPAPSGIDNLQRRAYLFNACYNSTNLVSSSSTDLTDFTETIGQAASSSALTLIDQISVIESRFNDRIKAARVRFGDLKAWRLNQTPVNLNLTHYDSFRRTNADGSTFREHSTCPGGRAAAGLLIYYDENNRGKKSITGLKLKCAPVQRVDEQPAQTTLQATPRRIRNNR